MNFPSPQASSSGLVIGRYSEAYRLVQILLRLASILKIVGYVVITLFSIPQLLLVSRGHNITFFFLVIVSAAFSLFILHIISALIRCAAFILQGVLDIAVNTSPMLADDQKGRILSNP